MRIGHIIAITGASLEEADDSFTAVFHSFMNDYIGSTIISTTNFAVQRGPLLTTKWGQGSKGNAPGTVSNDYAYNNYVKYAYRNNPNHPNANFYLVGCGPVAIAQIVTYHGYINMNLASAKKYMLPAFGTNSSNTIPGFGEWNGTYNFALLRDNQNQYIKNSSPNEEGGFIEGFNGDFNFLCPKSAIVLHSMCCPLEGL